MRLIELLETDSTNSWVSRNVSGLDSMTFVRASDQTAGRGQRGNSWESSPGLNLTFSLLWRPVSFPAVRQFAVSESVALGVVDALAFYGIQATVKWPNDIYVGDSKICGILIEHAVMGRDIMYSVCGVGLNVNQTVFTSDAPNPVSMAVTAGHEFDCGEVMRVLMDRMRKRLDAIGSLGSSGPDGVRSAQAAEAQHSVFTENMWRGDGRSYPFRDMRTGLEFYGRISGVGQTGMLSVEDGCQTREYAFKEIAFIL